MQVHRKFNHLVSRNIAFAVIARMRQAGIGQAETVVQLLFGQFRIRRIDHDETVADRLDQRPGFHPIRFGFDPDEILAERPPIFQTFFKTVQPQRLVAERIHIPIVSQEGHLTQFAQQVQVVTRCASPARCRAPPVRPGRKSADRPRCRPARKVSRVAPVIVMRGPAQRSSIPPITTGVSGKSRF